jgi:filamentous hemagglutinin family protein
MASAIDFCVEIFRKIFDLRRNVALRSVVTAAMIFGLAANTMANPTGLTVSSGVATVHVNGSQFTITASQNAFLNWKSFNIASGETTIFKQPSASSVVWNRINDPNPSQIFGSLQANGIVVLLNSSGFYFGPNSFVSAAGLVVSTANCAPPENAGGAWEFNGPPPLASIINYGHIQVGNGGQAFLIADQVENHGTIEAPGGTIGLAAGQTVLLSERPDGRGMSMQVKLPQGSVDNYGNLIADAGTISLNAKVVNQDGLLQADSVKNVNGVIELVADGSLNLGANSQILANGDGSVSVGSGGTVTLQSGNDFSDSAGSQISVAGGSQGGNGGSVEVSAPNILSLDSSVDATAQTGWKGGTFFLDPLNIIIGTTGSYTVAADGTVTYSGTSGTDSHGNLFLNVNSAFNNITAGQIVLQAQGDIYVGSGAANNSGQFSFAANPGITWNLGSGTGNLTLEAGSDILFGNKSQINAGTWNVNLMAGVSFPSGTVQNGIGSIYLGGGVTFNGTKATTQTTGGSIQTTSGDISLTAGQNIQINAGYVTTTGGGDITATALAGSVNTGTDTVGYRYSSSGTGYIPSPNAGSAFGNLGGISTANGGNVNITAGQNIVSLLPPSNLTTDAGSGAFGSEPGNVTLVAGGNVTGHYVVANGTGTIDAGNAGTSANELALSLVKGGWNVNAANNIYLQEVRNPNGIFNSISSFSSTYHNFDYAPDAYVNLTAGNGVQLGAGSTVLPRTTDIDIPTIYPPVLNITAGAGGVTIIGDTDSTSDYNKLILFPSQVTQGGRPGYGEGGLTITTTGGGSLTAVAGGSIFDLIVSDSGQTQFNDDSVFGLDDHATTPLYLNHATKVSLNISGDMDNILLGSPEAAQINVVGDMNNSRLQAQNLHATDKTTIDVGQTAKANMEASGILNPATDSSLYVGGAIENRGEFTTAALDTSTTGFVAPDLSLLGQAYPSTGLAGQIFYDSKTGNLTFQGAVTDQVLNQLSSVTLLTGYDKYGNPITSAPVNVLDPSTPAGELGPNALALQTQYTADGPIPTTLDSGYLIGGGGQFNVTARKLDLGTTLGIQSVGPEYNPVLANYFTKGADINVNLADELDMFSTSISSLNGGKIQVNVGVEVDNNGVPVTVLNPAAQVNVGSTVFTGNNNNPRGIFSTEKSDVTVYAGGDINLNGSRIATYDGGNVTVKSFDGNVDCGSGSSGYVVVQKISVDPVTRAITTATATIPGSGILATTFLFPDSLNTVGNIFVNTPNGNINANAGGIVQLPLNGVKSPDATVTLLAGYDLQNGTPQFVSAGRDIDVSGSGVIAQNASLKASGSINGLIFAEGNIDVSAQQNVNVTALAQGTANVSAGGNVSGTIIGVGGVAASGGSIDAALLSSGTISGQTSGQSGFAQGTAANATSAAASSENASQNAATSSTTDDNDDLKKKKPVALAQRVSRVTVILPGHP